MDSRRVVLLTKGYLHGWLDFKRKTKLSAAREEFLLGAIEEEEFSKVRYLRAITDSVIGGSLRSKEMLQAAFDSFNDYLELTLPYLNKKPKMDSEVVKNELADIKAFLKKKRLELNSQSPKK